MSADYNDGNSDSRGAAPVAVPNGDDRASLLHTYRNGEIRVGIGGNSSGNSEGTPLLPGQSPANKSLRCSPMWGDRNSSAWSTDPFIVGSPMVSGHRGSLRMPDLGLREVRRAAALAANARLRQMTNGSTPTAPKGRLRSRSTGSENEVSGILSVASLRSSSSQGLLSHSSSTLLLGEDILKRSTPSGLALMDLDDMPEANQMESEFTCGYGSTTADESDDFDLPLKGGADIEAFLALKEPKADMSHLKTQGCTAELPESSPKSPRTAREDREEKESAKQQKSSPVQEKTLVEELKEEFASQSSPPLLSLLYGIVNLFIVLPVIMSFGSIIYHDDFFRPYLSALMKLTVISGVVHQVTFSMLSSLPFAVGSVQDAGLIFLSAMARDVVSRLKSIGANDDAILATCTIGLSMYTAVLGSALVIIGKLKLASYCQLLPSSVVGGYLAFIGFFCGQAGLALMAMVDVSSIREWYKFLDPDALLLLMPGLIGGCIIYFSVRTLRHMAVLPSCIIMLLLFFYAVLWTTGTSVEEATENGWINRCVEAPSWTHSWDFLRFDKVVWSVLPSQTLTAVAMISVVALSSSLDIAAIEIELKRPLDFNHELKTVGISNMVSGITGGYTGSYIFSQTIFSLRMGIRSKLMGYLLAFFMMVAVVIPINILAYVPNFFFGSLLMMICLDLMFEWLIDVRSNVTPAEYVIVISTFVGLSLMGVEAGIIGGVILYIIVQRLGFDVGKDKELEVDVADYGSRP